MPNFLTKKPSSNTESYPGFKFIRDVVIITVIGLLFAFFIQNFLVKPYLIPSESILPTLEIGQRILVDKTAFARSEPEIGDVVVFHPPKNIEGFFHVLLNHFLIATRFALVKNLYQTQLLISKGL